LSFLKNKAGHHGRIGHLEIRKASRRNDLKGDRPLGRTEKLRHLRQLEAVMPLPGGAVPPNDTLATSVRTVGATGRRSTMLRTCVWLVSFPLTNAKSPVVNRFPVGNVTVVRVRGSSRAVTRSKVFSARL